MLPAYFLLQVVFGSASNIIRLAQFAVFQRDPLKINVCLSLELSHLRHILISFSLFCCQLLFAYPKFACRCIYYKHECKNQNSAKNGNSIKNDNSSNTVSVNRTLVHSHTNRHVHTRLNLLKTYPRFTGLAPEGHRTTSERSRSRLHS